MEVLKRAARRKCPECEGGGKFKGPYYGALPDCPPCGGTGLWLPELSRECPGSPCPYCNDPDHIDPDEHDCGTCGCEGTGHILNLDDPERLDAAAKRLGCDYGLWWEESETLYGYSYGGTEAIAPTLTEARQSALAAVVKEVWPEMEASEPA